MSALDLGRFEASFFFFLCRPNVQFVLNESTLRDLGKIESEHFTEAVNVKPLEIRLSLQDDKPRPGLCLLTDAPDQGVWGLHGVICWPLSLPVVPTWASGSDLRHVLAFSVRFLRLRSSRCVDAGVHMWEFLLSSQLKNIISMAFFFFFFFFSRKEFRERKGRSSKVSESMPKAKSCLFLSVRIVICKQCSSSVF